MLACAVIVTAGKTPPNGLCASFDNVGALEISAGVSPTTLSTTSGFMERF
jgi:hypothetical protein